ncbi:hypothetical protein FOA52_011888 [Chlamydomonas sp. UWO 241]|nr:hypothetical protein FOA52_011888 [Chlamydomonas sp. UWO 241]
MYGMYPYTSPVSILKYVRDRAPANSPEAVLVAIDEFSVAYPMYKIGNEKGLVLDSLVRAASPQLVVELGSFVRYSAVRIARLLPPGATLICVEANPECVEAMEGVLTHAGLRDRVVIRQGLAGDVVRELAGTYGPAQLLFEDHCKKCYLPDLRLAESTGLLPAGAWTIADNVMYPGAPDLLQHLGESGSYVGAIVPARYEYDQAWNPGWEPKADGMSVAIRVDGLSQVQRKNAQKDLAAFFASLEGKTCMPLTAGMSVA